MKNNKFIFGCVILTVFSFIFGCKLDTEKPVYTITYQSEKGNLPDSKQVEDGYVLTEEDLPTLTEEGYTFKGWDKTEGDVITEDTVITASWEKTPDTAMYTITYKSEKGTAPVSKTVEEGYALKAEDLPALTDKYYDFKGWNSAAGNVITADTTITASWQIRSCTVTYSSTLTGDGTKQIPASFTKDAGYKLTWEDVPCLGKDSSGQLFVGWGKSFGDEITNDITLTAEWQDEVYLSFGVGFEAILNDADDSLSVIFQKEPYEGDYKETYDCSTSNSYYTSYLTNDNKLIISGNGHKIVFPVSSQSLFSNYDNGGKISSFTFNNDCITSYVTNMALMFNYCSSITSIDMSNLDTSNVTNMGQMFEWCENLKTVNIGKTSATNMYGMFSECSHIEKVILDTSSATDMEGMFSFCQFTESLDISGFDTSSATTMKKMFSHCSGLKSLDLSGFNTSNVTKMEDMFSYCTKLEALDLSGFDTQKVTTMSSMFEKCEKLASLDITNFNTKKVTSISYMFKQCENITSLDLSSFDTSNVEYIGHMFAFCYNLETIYVGSKFSLDKLNRDATNTNLMFEECTALVGGNGTTYANAWVKGPDYARIDASKTPGYFTLKQ